MEDFRSKKKLSLVPSSLNPRPPNNLKTVGEKGSKILSKQYYMILKKVVFFLDTLYNKIPESGSRLNMILSV